MAQLVVVWTGDTRQRCVYEGSAAGGVQVEVFRGGSQDIAVRVCRKGATYHISVATADGQPVEVSQEVLCQE